MDVINDLSMQHGGVRHALEILPIILLCFASVNCGDPGTPANIMETGALQDTLEGSIVTYACETAFEMVGNHTQTCELTLNGAFWSYARPHCISSGRNE